MPRGERYLARFGRAEVLRQHFCPDIGAVPIAIRWGSSKDTQYIRRGPCDVSVQAHDRPVPTGRPGHMLERTSPSSTRTRVPAGSGSPGTSHTRRLRDPTSLSDS